MKNILVTTDLAANTHNALERAARLARESGAKLHILHVAPASRSPAQAASAGTRVVDAGLQSYMQSVYHAMGLGLAVTGLTAFATANTPVLMKLIFGTPLMWAVMLAPLGFIFFGFTPARISRMSSEKLKLLFIVFSAVMGLSMAAIFQVFTGASIARVFFITAATFAATSLYGYGLHYAQANGCGCRGLSGLYCAGFLQVLLFR